MKKKIIVLTGSPRIGGNSDCMAEAFIKGALKNKNNIKRFDVARMNVNSCKACDSCFKYGKACICDDEFNKIAIEMVNADVIVFVSPVYWSSFPSKLKSVIDKFYSFIIGDVKTNIKQSILLACGDSENEEKLQCIVNMYKEISQYNEWENKAVITVPKLSKLGEIKDLKILKEIEKLGEKI